MKQVKRVGKSVCEGKERVSRRSNDCTRYCASFARELRLSRMGSIDKEGRSLASRLGVNLDLSIKSWKNTGILNSKGGRGNP